MHYKRNLTRTTGFRMNGKKQHR